jgi:hypothetical protein
MVREQMVLADSEAQLAESKRLRTEAAKIAAVSEKLRQQNSISAAIRDSLLRGRGGTAS